jgi:hypothetical protein
MILLEGISATLEDFLYVVFMVLSSSCYDSPLSY